MMELDDEDDESETLLSAREDGHIGIPSKVHHWDLEGAPDYHALPHAPYDKDDYKLLPKLLAPNGISKNKCYVNKPASVLAQGPQEPTNILERLK
jgi:hypothetical protein